MQLTKGRELRRGLNPPFMVMPIWLQNNNELKTNPPRNNFILDASSFVFHQLMGWEAGGEREERVKK